MSFNPSFRFGKTSTNSNDITAQNAAITNVILDPINTITTIPDLIVTSLAGGAVFNMALVMTSAPLYNAYGRGPVATEQYITFPSKGIYMICFTVDWTSTVLPEIPVSAGIVLKRWVGAVGTEVAEHVTVVAVPEPIPIPLSGAGPVTINFVYEAITTTDIVEPIFYQTIGSAYSIGIKKIKIIRLSVIT